MKVKKCKLYSVTIVKRYPNYLFLYGSNLAGWGKGGQAIIRDLPNTYGIPTKKHPSNYNSSFFTDDEYEQNVQILKAATQCDPIR